MIRVVGLGCVAAACLFAQSEPVDRETVLLQSIQRLEARVNSLEQRLASLEGSPAVTPGANPNGASGETGAAGTPAITNPSGAPQATAGATPDNPLAGTTFSAMLDGYYGYNFNDPTGRINLLRAYDVSSNSFSLNQATLVVEHAPDVEAGNRAGVRVDLQYGQATETLQGNPTQENRPQVYQAVWQAYGTYVFPVGSGLTVDFGKWASALGVEGNYTKDQINYSRSYLFAFLPFYHFGFRSTYNINSHLQFAWWLVNGAGQSEDFNGFKSNAFLFTMKPANSITWNVNYYEGQEGRDVDPMLNPGAPPLATQPGLTTEAITPAPNGRTHIFDSYIALNITPKLLLQGEGDYYVARAFSYSAPGHVSAGALYLRYGLFPKFAVAARAEYLSDPNGLFSGAPQALKETTGTVEYKFSEGFLARAEWRKDFSNRLYFLTNTPGALASSQQTATLGMIWWFGGKQGAW